MFQKVIDSSNNRDSPSLDLWETVTVPLTEGGWKISGDHTAATVEAFLSVLSDLQGLYVYTEWRTGPDDTNIDNIRISGVGVGDFDANDMFNCADVDALVPVIAAGTHDPAFDLTGDGLVDNSDLDRWLRIAGAQSLPSGNPYLPADANLDGVVDGQDFLEWNTNKFLGVLKWCSGNFNADTVVDGQDFLIWNTYKFQSADDMSAVPEPSVWLLSCVGLVLLGAARKWR